MQDVWCPRYWEAQGIAEVGHYQGFRGRLTGVRDLLSMSPARMASRVSRVWRVSSGV